MNLQKMYVDVILKNDKNGEINPLVIILENDKKYKIDKIVSKCRASSLKVGGCGMRYSVNIRGRETYLFHEQDKWFVEYRGMLE